MENFAERLKMAMNYRGIKQIEVCKLTGIDRGTMSNYTNGKYKPKAKNILLIAKVLKVNAPWLLGAEGVPMEIDPTIDYHVSEDDVNTRTYLKLEYSNVVEMNISKDEWCAFYDKFDSLTEQAKIDILKYLYLQFAVSKLIEEEGGD